MNPPPMPSNPAEDKGPMILAVMWTLTLFTTLFVVARWYVRLFLVKSLGLDDWLALVGTVFNLAYLGVTTANILVGYGKHAGDLTLPQFIDAVKLNTISFIFGILAFSIPKLAVAAMLNRILNPSRVQKYVLWGVVILAFCISVACIFMLMFMCNPPRALWDVTVQNPVCYDVWILINYAIFTGVYSAFTDMYLAIYPITVLLKLHMSLQKKLALSAALSLGAIASAMAVVKCTQLKGLANRLDYTYGTAELVLWTSIEANIVILASSIPTLPRLFEKIFKRKFGGTSNNDNKYYKKYGKDQSSSGNQKFSPYKGPTGRSKKTMDTTLSTTNVESQESIIPADERSAGAADDGIRRTDDVTIEYEMEDWNNAKRGQRPW